MSTRSTAPPGNHAAKARAPALRTAMLATLAGGAIMSAALGARQTFGLFIEPFSIDHGLPVTLIAFAIALHNIVWGVAQPFAGAASDRFGPAPVVAFGAFAFAGGLGLTAMANSGAMLILGMGLFVGVGISCTSFGVVMAAVGKSAPIAKRSMAMGLANAGGSVGQVLLVPVAQGVTSLSDAGSALLVLAAVLVAVAPLGLVLDRTAKGAVAAPAGGMGIGEALLQATHHRGFILLTLGFFVCGFQLAFIATYLPSYLSLCHMPVGLGASALALIGLFNIVGSWGCGWLGARFQQQHVLGWLYLLRGAAIGAFYFLPKTNASVVVFAVAMGLLWLGAVPLTTGLIARFFGVGNLGMLFGICFLNHQIGSFLGSWAGGYALDASGSYEPVWIAAALAGAVAALLHFAITDHPKGSRPIAATSAA